MNSKDAIAYLIVAAGLVLGIAVITVILLLAIAFAARTLFALDNRLARIRNKRRAARKGRQAALQANPADQAQDADWSPSDSHIEVDDIGPDGEPMIHIDAGGMAPERCAELIVQQTGLQGAEAAALYRDMMCAMDAACANGHTHGTIAVAVPIGRMRPDLRRGEPVFKGPVS